MADGRTSPILQDDLEVLRSSELFPKRKTVYDDATIPQLTADMHGESVLYLGKCGKECNQFLALTTYRLIIVHPTQWFIVMPVGMILSVETPDGCTLHVRFKDGRHCSISFNTAEKCSTWNARLSAMTSAPSKIQDFFAFSFHAWLIDTNEHLKQQAPNNLSWFYSECTRLGFQDHPLWRVSDGNVQFGVCKSYPHLTIVPRSCQDSDIRQVAKNFRSQGRYPAVVWRHRGNGAVLARCSQPLVGLLGYQRCCEDEKVVEEIAKVVVLDRALMKGALTKREAMECTVEPDIRTALGETLAGRVEAPSMLVVDMRTYAAAFANRGRGGGTESRDYYPCIEPVYHKVPNIHTVLQSFEAMSQLCQSRSSNSSTWMSQLEATQWLHYLSGLLESAVHIAHTMCVEGRPVLVHCSDGWDRTTQATALTQLLADPFYRTFEGFTTLVKREWLSFGHKFASRSGHPSADTDQAVEFSPIFVQWLDAVHQLMRQFPMAFEYNETFLIKLGTHVYSHLFGNFLCNREKDRITMKGKTLDVWVMLNKKRKDFVNFLYTPGSSDVIVPKFGVQHLLLWSSMYMRPLRQVMPGGSDVVEGSQLLSPVATSANISPLLSPPVPGSSSECQSPNVFEVAMRSSLQIKTATTTSRPASLLERLKEQSRNKDAPAGQTRSNQKPGGPPSEPVSFRDTANRQHKPFFGASSEDVAQLRNASSNGLSRSPARSIPCTRSSANCGEPEALSSSYEYVSWSSPSSSLTNRAVYHPPPISGQDGSKANARTGTPTSGGGSNGFRVASAKVVSTPKRQRAAALADVHSVEEALENTPDDASLMYRTCSSCLDGEQTPCNELSSSATSAGLTSTGARQAQAVAMPSPSLPSHSNGGNGDVSPAAECSAPAEPAGHGTAQRASSEPDATAPIELAGKARNGSVTRTDGGSHADVLDRRKTSAEVDSGYPSTPSSPPSHQLSDGMLASTDGRDEEEEEPWLIPGRMLDSDGLPLLCDPVQASLYNARSRQEREVAVLRAHIRRLQSRLQHRDASDGSLPSSVEASRPGEGLPAGDADVPSSCASSLSRSWESVQEEDGVPTLWVPDHAVNNCTQCNAVFWVYVRKHHCRNCGGVFCGTCSNYFVPVPKEQLLEPVRVCSRCFDKLDGPRYYLELDKQNEVVVVGGS